jgi:hypothetical protein
LLDHTVQEQERRLEVAPLQLDLEGWRFIYTVNRKKGHLRVREHKLIVTTPTSLRKRWHRR